MNSHILLTLLSHFSGKWISGAIGHKCPGLIADSRTSSHGNFSSPAWPAPYPPDAVCNYRLQGVPWEGVKITFYHFDLEPPYTAGCLSDYLELATVDVEGTRTFRGRFCGNSVPPPILLLHPTVELVFRSNHAVHHEGFFASYEFIDEVNVTPPRLNGTSPCGDVETGIGGVISSPGYPIGYPAGLDCLWLIRVPYSHAIYIRIQQLEFQGSIANCEKAELGIYDGYEHSLESGEALKRYCGDLRYYKGEDERVLLSSRNRLLIRFQTREPSKPVVTSGSSVDLNVGFRLIWSDVEFNTPENCSKQSRFACTEARFCFTKNHIGGTSNCPDIRHYCISSDLVCDNLAHCSEQDASDEQNCYPEGTVLFLILAPLGLLLLSLFLCFLCCKRTAVLQIPQKSGQQNVVKADQDPPNCWSKGSATEGNKSTHGRAFLGNMDLAPIPRLPITLGPNQECSPGASEIVSPASGFSDTESDSGSGQFLQHLAYCPAHGPVGPLRHFPLPYPLLPVLQEGSGYGSETYDEGGSTISSQNSEDLLNVSVLYKKDFDEPSSKAVQTWRLHQLRRSIRRSDAVCMSDDGKSSGASSPSRICPRCLEKEGRVVSTQSSLTSAGIQFDSGVDSLKNMSFDTVTSSELSMSRYIGALGHFNNASIQTDDLGDSSITTNDSFCTTVTTFGVKDAGKEMQKAAKATEV